MVKKILLALGLMLAASVAEAQITQPTRCKPSAAAPTTCSAATEGRCYTDTDDHYIYYCDATNWTALVTPAQIVPCGSDTYVQFNDSGACGADAGLTYNKTANVLTLTDTANAAYLGLLINGNSAGASAYRGLSIYEGATQQSSFQSIGSGNSGATGGANALQIYNHRSAPIVFGTNGAEVFRLNVAGASGGTALLSDASATGGFYMSSHSNTAGQAGFHATNDRGAAAVLVQADCWGSAHAGGALLGVARADFCTVFSGGTSSTGLGIGTLTSDPVVFGTNNAESFRVDTNGDVDIAASKAVLLASKAMVATAPTIAAGFCTSPSISASNGTAAFTITIGTSCTGVSTGSVTLPAATTGWVCHFANVTNPATSNPSQTGGTTTTATVTNYARTTGLAADWTASDVVRVQCMGY